MGGRGDNDRGGRHEVASFAAGLLGSLDGLAADPSTGQDTVRRRVRSVIEACGAEKRTLKLLGELSDALEDAGLFFSPDVTDIGLGWSSWVTFSRRPLIPEPVKELFPGERSLELYLADNLALIDGLGELRVLRTQFELPNGERIDLLCEDTTTGEVVVVELKRATPGRAVFQQVISYVLELREVPRFAERAIRAVIITGHADHELQTHALHLATKVGVDLSWFVYDVTFAVTEVASTGIPSPTPRPDPATSPKTASVTTSNEAPVGHYDDRAISAQRPYRG